MDPSCDITSMPRFGKQSQFHRCGFPERHRAAAVRLRRSCRIAAWERPPAEHLACGRPLGPAGPVVQTNPICVPIVPNKPNFRPDRKPGYPRHSTILLFHHSSPMRIVPNKPNSSAGTGPEGHGTRGKCAKQTQFAAAPRGARVRRRGSNLRNKANSAAAAGWAST